MSNNNTCLDMTRDLAVNILADLDKHADAELRIGLVAAAFLGNTLACYDLGISRSEILQACKELCENPDKKDPLETLKAMNPRLADAINQIRRRN